MDTIVKTSKFNTPSQADLFGVGKSVVASSVQDAIEQAQMNWTVRKVDLQTKEQGIEPIHVHNHFAIVRDDSNLALGVVGNEYTPVQNVESVKIIEKITETGELIIRSGGVFQSGRICWLTTQLPEPLEVGPELIDQNIIVKWSHTGDSRVSAAFIPYRRANNVALVCHNGHANNFSRKHTKRVLSNINHSAEIMKLAKAYFADIHHIFTNMVNTDFSDQNMKDYLNVLFPPSDESARANTRNENIRDKIMNIWKSENPEISNTQWAAWNSVAAWADFDKKPRVCGGKDEKEMRLESIWFGTAANKKDEAFSLLLN
jgi:phage/plasmid-like protein (TIGR03299 family)